MDLPDRYSIIPHSLYYIKPTVTENLHLKIKDYGTERFLEERERGRYP